MTMKNIKTFVVVAVLALISSSSFAQTVTATASTLDGAEAQIAAKAKLAGSGYSITEAYAGNQVHMTARLTK
jgi:Tfp pilus assembly protein PilE